MEQIYQSAVLQALGWAIADSLWQMALLWLGYQLFIVLPFRQPSLRHAGAAVALFSGGIWFCINVIYKLSHSTSGVPGNGNLHPTLMGWIQGLLPYLSTAYLVILVVLMARFMHAIFLTQRLRITEVAPARQWQDFVDNMALRFFIERKVWVRITEAVNVPATIGFMKPVILLPLASVNNLSTAQVEAIIMHELAHIRRNDYLVNLLASLVENFLFFNPFAHLLVNQMRKECELCCDDEVILHRQDPGQYAQALLLLETNRQRLPLAMAATGKEPLLLGRVKRILNQPEQKVKYRHKLLALVLVAGMVMGLSLLDPAGKKTAAPTPVKTARVETVVTRFNAEPANTNKGRNNRERTDLTAKPSPLPALHGDHIAPVDIREEALGMLEPFEPFAPSPKAPVAPVSPVPPPAVAHPEDAVDPFVFIHAPEDRDIARMMEELSEGRLLMEMDQRFRDMKMSEETIRRMAEGQHRFNVEMERFERDVNRRNGQLKVRTAEPPRPPKPPRAGQPASGNIRVEAPDEVGLKAIAMVSPKAFRTIRTEDGVTINIVEEDKMIRISISNR